MDMILIKKEVNILKWKLKGLENLIKDAKKICSPDYLIYPEVSDDIIIERVMKILDEMLGICRNVQ